MARKPVSSEKPVTRRRGPDAAAVNTPRKSARAPSSRKTKPPRQSADSPFEADEILEQEEQHSDAETESEEAWPDESELSEETEGPLPAVEKLPVVAATDLVSSWGNDPLRRYLDEVRRYPMLDPGTEAKLAERMRSLNDLDAAKALVQANLRLVVKIAFEYQNITTNLLDLIQEGNIGLMKAVSKFDPAKGVKLGYYATWWIRSYILKYLLDNFRLVKIGTTQAQKKLFYHLMREKQRLEAQGLFAGPKLLAERLDVREKDVVEMEQRLSGRGAELSLDAPIESGSDDAPSRTFQEVLADPQESQEQRLEREQWLRLLEQHIPSFRQELNEKERRILDERLLSDDPKTLQEIADRYGLTRERARQIEAKLLEKLRERLREHLSR